MVVPEQSKLYTMDEFKEFVIRPENADRLFELINGEIIEVSPGRTSNSRIGHLIAVAVYPFCQEHGFPCYTSGGDGAYAILGNTVAPDFAYKRTPTSNEYPDPEPPLWVVEIISPTDKPSDIRKKRQIYRQAGILYWEMYPDVRGVDVYPPGQPMREVGIDDTLDGGDVLPGFTLPVRELFAQ
jgi:Uma2 family endonuclease